MRTGSTSAPLRAPRGSAGRPAGGFRLEDNYLDGELLLLFFKLSDNGLGIIPVLAVYCSDNAISSALACKPDYCDDSGQCEDGCSSVANISTRFSIIQIENYKQESVKLCVYYTGAAAAALHRVHVRMRMRILCACTHNGMRHPHAFYNRKRAKAVDSSSTAVPVCFFDHAAAPLHVGSDPRVAIGCQ